MHPILYYALIAYSRSFEYETLPEKVVESLTCSTFQSDFEDMGLDPTTVVTAATNWLSAPENMLDFLQHVVVDKEQDFLGSVHHTGAESLSAILWVFDNMA